MRKSGESVWTRHAKLFRPEICAGGLSLAAGFHCAATLLLGIVADLGQMSINVRGCDFFFFFFHSKVKGTDLESSQQILSVLFNIV